MFSEVSLHFKGKTLPLVQVLMNTKKKHQLKRCHAGYRPSGGAVSTCRLVKFNPLLLVHPVNSVAIVTQPFVRCM